MPTRPFYPIDGRLSEIDIPLARRMVEAKIWPVLVMVEREHGVLTSRVQLATVEGVYQVAVPTGQARKVAEAALWVSAIHAVALLGVWASGALAAARAAPRPMAQMVRDQAEREAAAR